MSEANNQPLKDFTELHDGIKAELKRRIPELDTVELYDPTDLDPSRPFSVDTPAVLIEMVEGSPGELLTGGRQPFDCEFQLHCILSKKTPQLPLAVRNLAATVAQVVVRGAPDNPEEQPVNTPPQNWGLSGKAVKSVKPDAVSLYPGMFKPGSKGKEQALGYDSMIVAFEQTVYLGDLLINPPEYLPGQITIGGDVTITNDWESPEHG